MYDQEKKKQSFTPGQAKSKAESYCAYQERSQQEVRDKLYEWGQHQEDVEKIIGELITDNFLNEERFALAYASGKFRMKAWGLNKIKQGLTFKKVSTPLIKIALSSIEEDDYLKKLDDILLKKVSTLKDQNPYILTNKLVQYAVSRGFESSLVYDWIHKNKKTLGI
ncbi:regulatory protein RecX [Sphingobacterium sp. SYP-B4668]|uniref:regulatory protein RecX n=1 Tax=Sphingobacterium sp. SYP-B4668 TaxID=2996035 RepID=UPI0022DD47D8|nr:regulatory protein RecX [Sphingobacterium sp. SYP-B4668]